MKLPVHVCTFPDKIAMVDACAAALRQQRDGAAFSRAEALRIAAMEWLKKPHSTACSGEGPLPFAITLRLLLDSRVVDVPMAYNSTFVMLSFLNADFRGAKCCNNLG
jgi:hypothetical protein